MLPFKRILFPMDFSQRCSEAGDHIAALVKHFKAELTLLHVIDAAPLGYYGMDPAMSIAAAYAQMMAEERQRDLNCFMQDSLLNLPVKRILEHGDAARTIVEYARKNESQLIMMPTHGYGPFRQFLLGSVTAKVLHDAECPVWTSVHTATANLPKNQCYRSILCAVDLTSGSVPVLRSAAELVDEFDGVLHLVHAIAAPEARPGNECLDPQFRRFLFETVREEIQNLQREAGTQAQPCIDGGDVSKVVRTAALRHQADLVVIGRGGIHGTLGRLRTHSYAIIRESPCPVLSV